MNLESLNCWRSNRRLGFIWRRLLIVSHIISIQNVYFPISTIGNIWHTLNECNRQFQLPIQLTHGTKLPQKKRKYLKTFVKCFSGVDQTKIIWCHINRINMSKPPSAQNWNRCKAFFCWQGGWPQLQGLALGVETWKRWMAPGCRGEPHPPPGEIGHGAPHTKSGTYFLHSCK